MTQLKAVKYAGLGRGYAFKDEDGEAPTARSTPALAASPANAVSKFESAFEDDDDDLDAAVEPATPSLLPPPKKVATVVKKKVVAGKA